MDIIIVILKLKFCYCKRELSEGNKKGDLYALSGKLQLMAIYGRNK